MLARCSQGRWRPVLVAVTLRRPIRVVLALRTDDLVDLEFHQLVNDTEPDTHAQREQALLRCPDKLAQRHLDLQRERLSDASKVVTTFGADTFFMAVPPVLADLVSACHARNASGRG